MFYYILQKRRAIVVYFIIFALNDLKKRNTYVIIKLLLYSYISYIKFDYFNIRFIKYKQYISLRGEKHDR